MVSGPPVTHTRSEREADAHGLHAGSSLRTVKQSTAASSQNPEMDGTLRSFSHDS